MDAGLDIDAFAPRISFFWAVGMPFAVEVAKLRGACLWARLMKTFDPKNPKSMSLRTHCQTSGWSLTAQDVHNNVVRTCTEALAAAHGHTQSLHTNSFDEALALPSEESARIAKDTNFCCKPRPTCATPSTRGAAAALERLTHDLAHRAWEHIVEAESYGGMSKAIERASRSFESRRRRGRKPGSTAGDKSWWASANTRPPRSTR